MRDQLTDAVDAYVQNQMRAASIPGVSVGIAREGRILARYYGCSNVEHDSATNSHSVYKIGSISKQFIAAAVLLLVEEGRIRLDDSATEHLIDPPLAWEAITVRQLLSHTSGLARESPVFDPFVDRPNREVVSAAYGAPLQFAPGTAWLYSNLGYAVLAEIMERATGVVFYRWITQRIFAVANLGSTRVCSVADIVRYRAASYLQQAGHLTNAGDFPVLRPSGAFLSNAEDLLRWDSVLRRDSLLSEESRRVMEAPMALSNGSMCEYGLGWELSNVNGRRLVHHGGTLWCFRAEFARYVDDGLAVVVLANHMDAKAHDMALAIAGLVDPALAPSAELLLRIETRRA